MIQHIFNSRNFVACLPGGYENDALFQAAIPRRKCLPRSDGSPGTARAQRAFLLLPLLVYAPYIAYSILPSSLHVFGLTVHKGIRAGQLPPSYPDSRKRNELFLVVGEIHKWKPEASETPYRVTIPERTRFTGTAIVGAIGTRKDELLHVPFLGQILAYRASDDTKRIGATVSFVLRSHRRAQTRR